MLGRWVWGPGRSLVANHTTKSSMFIHVRTSQLYGQQPLLPVDLPATVWPTDAPPPGPSEVTAAAAAVGVCTEPVRAICKLSSASKRATHLGSGLPSSVT